MNAETLNAPKWLYFIRSLNSTTVLEETELSGMPQNHGRRNPREREVKLAERQFSFYFHKEIRNEKKQRTWINQYNDNKRRKRFDQHMLRR